jgi:uncharacterized membrane protein
MNRKAKILIICSLLLNVLLVGTIIGHISYRLTERDFGRRHGPRLSAGLPEEKRKLLMDALEQVHRENRGIHGEIRETREKVISILTAAEFDEAAYRVEVEKVHELRGLMMKRLAEATTRLAKDFNPEERRALAEVLRRPPRPPWGRKKRHNGPPPEYRP